MSRGEDSATSTAESSRYVRARTTQDESDPTIFRGSRWVGGAVHDRASKRSRRQLVRPFLTFAHGARPYSRCFSRAIADAPTSPVSFKRSAEAPVCSSRLSSSCARPFSNPLLAMGTVRNRSGNSRIRGERSSENGSYGHRNESRRGSVVVECSRCLRMHARCAPRQPCRLRPDVRSWSSALATSTNARRGSPPCVDPDGRPKSRSPMTKTHARRGSFS